MDVDGKFEDLAAGTDGEAPKKSSPSKESAALACLGGAEDFDGGGRAPGVSVVLGLAGA